MVYEGQMTPFNKRRGLGCLKGQNFCYNGNWKDDMMETRWMGNMKEEKENEAELVTDKFEYKGHFKDNKFSGFGHLVIADHEFKGFFDENGEY
jgi:hypothetical protein